MPSLVHELWLKECKVRPLFRSPDDGSTAASLLQQLVQSFLPLAWEEMQRHKWLESEKARRDLGHAAIEDWLKRFWWKFCRWRRLEHVEGQCCWREFNDLDFAILTRICMERGLLQNMLARMKGDDTHIHDNLEIILWALDDANISYQRVEEFLLLIDINAARLPVPPEWRFKSAA